jgi:hypothetical protein
MTRSLRIALVAISLSFGSLTMSSLDASSANAASKASLRTFCIDYQDFATFNPTGMSEWKMQLSAVKRLEHEAPASMKSVLKSTAGLLQTLINQNLHLTKSQARTARNLDTEDQSKEQSLCSKYAGLG